MPSKSKIKQAYEAMKSLGVEEKRVKPVLKNLLKLYEKKWDLIEEENYRVLADAIFEEDDFSMPEREKKENKNKKEDEDYEEEEESSVRPLKRLRKGRDINQSPNVGESLGLRAEDHQVSPQKSMKQKGKEPMCSEPEVPDLSSSRGVCFKEPMAESGRVHCPRETPPKMHPLVKPKDEPFSGDMLINEVPVAVIYPDHSSNKDVLMVENGENRGRNDTMSEEDTPKEQSLKLDVASSSLGEVKLSLSHCMAVGERKFHMPTLEAVIKLTEEKCLRSYKITDPKFSVMGLLGNVCESFLELGTDLVKKSQDKDSSKGNMSNSQTHDALKTPESSTFLDGTSENLRDRFETSNEHVGAEFDVGEKTSNGTMRNSPTHDILEKPTSMAVSGGSQENIAVRFNTTDEQMPSESDLNGKNLTEVDKSQGSLDETVVTLDVLEKSTVFDALEGSKEKPFVPSEASNEQVGSGFGASNEKNLLEVGAENILRPFHDVNDITKGEENVEVPWINAENSEIPANFVYIPQSIVFDSAEIEISLSKIGDLNSCPSCYGDCLSASLPCACARETGGHFAYTPAGSVNESFLEDCISLTRDPLKQCRTFCEECPLEKSKGDDCLELCKGHSKRKFIKECWSKCGCNKRCGNRVVQRGITRNLQVFFASNEKGWGLRTLEELPKGAFICEYAGEILTTTELFEKHPKSAKDKNDTFLAVLDAEWGSKATQKPEKALSLDASQYGNVARFINHRCLDANLIEIPVEVETPARHYYHLAFFTTRKVAALEELTWDYGIDFDDHDHPIKTFPCHCGSKFCRNIKRRTGSQPASN